MLFLKLFRKIKEKSWFEDVLLTFLLLVFVGLIIFLDTFLEK